MNKRGDKYLPGIFLSILLHIIETKLLLIFQQTQCHVGTVYYNITRNVQNIMVLTNSHVLIFIIYTVTDVRDGRT